MWFRWIPECCGNYVYFADVLDNASNAAVMYSYVPMAHHLLDPAVFQAPCQYRKHWHHRPFVLYRVFISLWIRKTN